ncbi:DNA-packaging protein [Entomomonas asaccharolytica]|uniref:DNA-packaging protein n=1 Tax=Entomomonas asaccharolytica TaxID=2785331 RepID=A0A974RY83_9GAMM|nr:DNA-packaging protein [Entomomonas asaccharolytica]QQP86932.1 DNA-packaging protein [Entomomonas asaccharolytica]
MPAPKGNQFWKARTKHGRDKIFNDPEVLWNACCEYFEWVENNPLYESKAFAYQGEVKIETLPKMRAMTISGICIFLDISRSTWDEWRRVESFSNIITRAEEIIRDQKFTGAAAELLNPNIIARDLGLSDKQELTGKDGNAIKIENKPDLSELSDKELELYEELAILRSKRDQTGESET